MEPRKPSLLLVCAISSIIVALIMFGVLFWKVDIHGPIVIATCIVCFCGVAFLKIGYRTLEESMINSVLVAMQSIFIMWTVGVVIGTWITSGIVPSMIYYGLEILSPSIFLLASFIICSIVSLATGTSWGTVGTIGLSLLGISLGLGIPAPIVAGAIISGAFFGDKMSPLSDTTILAPAVAGTDLFLHIKAMIWTTGPTFVIVSVILLFMGFQFSGGNLESAKIDAMLAIMRNEFWISPIAFIAPLVVIGLSASKKPALPSIWAGILIAMAFIAVQGHGPVDMFNALQNGYTSTLAKTLSTAVEDISIITKFIADNELSVAPEVVIQAAKDITRLVNRGGLQSMNWTVSLMVLALAFGGAMECCGFFNVILETIMKGVKTVPGLIFATGVSSLLSNCFLGDAYLSIAVPGRIYKPAFDKMGLHPRMLSRTLEDWGTLTAGLVPWCTGGVFCAGTLGVATLTYLPYAFLLWMNPIVAVVITYLGIGIYWKDINGEPVLGKKRPLIEKPE
ncbi:MAG: Na+/H+ antiporter NhaC [Synergistaceae bacterium]|nr:Na+/H+ antiporter NhaC [Synergistaceae bacterium]